MKYNYDIDLATASDQYLKILRGKPVESFDFQPQEDVVERIISKFSDKEYWRSLAYDWLNMLEVVGCQVITGGDDLQASFPEIEKKVHEIAEAIHDACVIEMDSKGHKSKLFIPITIIMEQFPERYLMYQNLAWEAVNSIMEAGYNIYIPDLTA